MEIGKQIKKFRAELKFSQDELAEKIHVSRQTISNWENDKNYPDFKSLLLLSELFNTTLDNLMKGDIEMIKQEMNADEIRNYNQHVKIFIFLFIAIILTLVPLVKFLDTVGIAIWVLQFAVTFCYAIKIEKLKKKLNLHTYKEIVAFMENKPLDNNQKIMK